MAITIDNTKEASVGGTWSNPGASFYDKLLSEPNWQALLREAYGIAPTGNVKRDEEDRTSFSASGMRYPHHAIRAGKLVLHRTGLRAAFSRGEQMGVVKGDFEAHLKRHYREMGWYEESSISEDEAAQSAIDEQVDNVLAHFGVIGMKWGVRKDRSSGESRSGAQSAEAKPLTDQQLRDAVSRLQLERQYKDLTKRELSPGQRFVKESMQQAGKAVVSAMITKGVAALTQQNEAAKKGKYNLNTPQGRVDFIQDNLKIINVYQTQFLGRSAIKSAITTVGGKEKK